MDVELGMLAGEVDTGIQSEAITPARALEAFAAWIENTARSFASW